MWGSSSSRYQVDPFLAKPSQAKPAAVAAAIAPAVAATLVIAFIWFTRMHMNKQRMG
jgi:hypothetical protein